MAKDKAVLFISVNKPMVGKDQEAINLWVETPSWLEKQQRAGWFQRFDGIWLTAHGGKMNSAWLCYGDRAKLDEWRRTDEFEAWIFRAQMCMDDMSIVPGITAEAMRDAIDRRRQATSLR